MSARGLPTFRSAIQKAIAFNPDIMQAFYLDLIPRQLYEAVLTDRIRCLDGFIVGYMPLFQ